MPNILKGRHNPDIKSRHYKSNSTSDSLKSEKEADRKCSVVMVGCGGVGRSDNVMKH